MGRDLSPESPRAPGRPNWHRKCFLAMLWALLFLLSEMSFLLFIQDFAARIHMRSSFNNHSIGSCRELENPEIKATSGMLLELLPGLGQGAHGSYDEVAYEMWKIF